ncbi:hypothetical protein [Paractinoplanes rishiriensis]|uniref:hypothetical protein n=1 Tax=Paractinoplanes rishiriensis TaxID=1050105 RepID=UPI001944495C|nr:hypothetical protein [Actinoplanes rishiriensis]
MTEDSEKPDRGYAPFQEAAEPTEQIAAPRASEPSAPLYVPAQRRPAGENPAAPTPAAPTPAVETSGIENSAAEASAAAGGGMFTGAFAFPITSAQQTGGEAAPYDEGRSGQQWSSGPPAGFESAEVRPASPAAGPPTGDAYWAPSPGTAARPPAAPGAGDASWNAGAPRSAGAGRYADLVRQPDLDAARTGGPVRDRSAGPATGDPGRASAAQRPGWRRERGAEPSLESAWDPEPTSSGPAWAPAEPASGGRPPNSATSVSSGQPWNAANPASSGPGRVPAEPAAGGPGWGPGEPAPSSPAWSPAEAAPSADPFGLPMSGRRIEPTPPPRPTRLFAGIAIGLIVGLLVFGAAGWFVGRSTAPDATAAVTPKAAGPPALGVFERSQVDVNRPDFAGTGLGPVVEGFLPYLSSCARSGQPNGPALNRGEKVRVRCTLDGMSAIFVEYTSTAERDRARQRMLDPGQDAREETPGIGPAVQRAAPSGRTEGNYVEYAYRLTEEGRTRTVSGLWWDDAQTPIAGYLLAFWKEGIGESWEPMRDLWSRYA